MDSYTNLRFKTFTTMKLGWNARLMGGALSPRDIDDLYHNATAQHLPVFVLGSGSNVIAPDEGYPGIIVRNRITGFEIIADDTVGVTIKVGAGENWDEVVKRTVDMNLSGIETMSAIPGTAGAAPVQNVGAYGQEIADTLISLEAYDIKTDQIVQVEKVGIGCSYRQAKYRGSSTGR